MVVVHVASGTRDILVFWAAWPSYGPRLTIMSRVPGPNSLVAEKVVELGSMKSEARPWSARFALGIRL
jgi:hypothetical protein